MFQPSNNTQVAAGGIEINSCWKRGAYRPFLVPDGRNFVRVLLEEPVSGPPFDSVSAAGSLVPATFDSSLGGGGGAITLTLAAAAASVFMGLYDMAGLGSDSAPCTDSGEGIFSFSSVVTMGPSLPMAFFRLLEAGS